MLATGGALIVLGSLVRWESFLGAAAISAPVGLIVVWYATRWAALGVEFGVRAIATAALTLAFVGGFQIANRQYYQRDPEWRNFLTFNALRAQFNDYSWIRYTPETQAIFDRVHWSENDQAMIANWYFDDPRIYSLANLREITSSHAWAQEQVSGRMIGAYWREIMSDRSLWAFWLFLPLGIGFARNRRLAFRFLAIATSLIALLLLALMFTKIPPARVYYPAYAFQVLVSLLAMRFGAERAPLAVRDWVVFNAVIVRNQGSKRRETHLSLDLSQPFVNFAVAAMLTIVLLSNGYQEYRHGRRMRRENAAMLAAIDKIHPRDDQLFVIWSSCFPFEAILPLDSPARSLEISICSAWVGCSNRR